MVKAPKDVLAIFREGRLIDQAMIKGAWEATSDSFTVVSSV